MAPRDRVAAQLLTLSGGTVPAEILRQSESQPALERPMPTFQEQEKANVPAAPLEKPQPVP
jgi:hypothetical protein